MLLPPYLQNEIFESTSHPFMLLDTTAVLLETMVDTCEEEEEDNTGGVWGSFGPLFTVVVGLIILSFILVKIITFVMVTFINIL